MQNIKQAIYTRPEIRHCIKPLWSAWIIVLIGALCGAIYLIGGGMSPSLSSLFLYMAALGVLTLLFIICFYLFGDSRFPYSKPLHRRLEPTLTYYPESSLPQLTEALEKGDEAALATVKRVASPQLVLVRYSDEPETVYYSQILRYEGKNLIPLTDIFINNINK
ncbi:MAG: hypothetical protein SPM02_03765 [Bacteroidales bacterium]|nr:hypothetical protein [Bacteroidales bacterium]